jgi:hypothetical protein
MHINHCLGQHSTCTIILVSPDGFCPEIAERRLLARVPLGPRLVLLPPSFYPLNPNVLAVGGPHAVRLLYLEPAVEDKFVIRQVRRGDHSFAVCV